MANGETLPESFTFHLMGADNQPKPYFQPVTGRDQVFAFAAKAKALSRTMSEVIYIPEDLKLTIPYQVGFQLSSPSLAKLSHYLGSKVISAKTMGHYVVEQLLIVRERPAEQLAAEWSRNPLIPISQHSSIVLNQQVSQCCVAYDLAIGQCEAFYHEQGKLWFKLVLKADWRNKDNGDTNTRRYYREGTLPDHETKRYMHRPDDVLPKGKFGVVNEYTASEQSGYDKPTQRYIPIVEEKEITSALGNITIGKNAVHDLPQWEWPKPLTPQQVQKELVAERLRTRIKDQELP